MITAIIGRKVEIKSSSNSALVGLKGKVLDETKNLLTLETSKGIKKIVKKYCVFIIQDEEDKKNRTVNGSDIVGTPADRIKKSWKK